MLAAWEAEEAEVSEMLLVWRRGLVSWLLIVEAVPAGEEVVACLLGIRKVAESVTWGLFNAGCNGNSLIESTEESDSLAFFSP